MTTAKRKVGGVEYYATTPEELAEEYRLMTPEEKRKLTKMHQTGGY